MANVVVFDGDVISFREKCMFFSHLYMIADNHVSINNSVSASARLEGCLAVSQGFMLNMFDFKVPSMVSSQSPPKTREKSEKPDRYVGQ